MDFDFNITDPECWVDKDGKHPSALTTITIDDIQEGRWSIVYPSPCMIEQVKQYFEALKRKQA